MGKHVQTALDWAPRSNFPFRKRSLPFETVVAIFETVVAISIHAGSDKNAGVHENR